MMLPERRGLWAVCVALASVIFVAFVACDGGGARSLHAPARDAKLRSTAGGGAPRATASAPSAASDPSPPAPKWVNPCVGASPLSSTVVCDHTRSLSARVDSLVEQLTLTEKVGFFSNNATGVPRLGIPGYQWWNEALHGVANSPGVQWAPHITAATSFPQVITSAASFNRSLFYALGEAVGIEARAFYNSGQAGLTFWAPNINIFRDPRWGRGQETPGEDPMLTAAYAGNFPRGMQGELPQLRVSSCCKHFAGYSLEDWGGTGRDYFDARIGFQDMHDTYLPAFQSCVQKSRASGVMCSYNKVNGVPSCASPELLRNTLRSLWGFDGYVTGDCGAVYDIQMTHKYTTFNTTTVLAALDAGVDIDCGDFLSTRMPGCIQNTCNATVLDPSLKRLFRVQMRLGMFDPPEAQPYTQLGPRDVATPEHRALALDAARQGMVLLENKKTLPLDVSMFIKSGMLLVGPYANQTERMLGNYYGKPPHVVSALTGVRDFGVEAEFVPGCDNILCKGTNGFPQAIEAAVRAQHVVLFVGLDGDETGTNFNDEDEREAHDRTVLTLPGMQHALIQLVAENAKKPITVVVFGGGAVDLAAEKQNPKVGAILWVGYPGQAGGIAIAETLFGNNNPSGRLTQTFYHDAFARQVSMWDMGMRPNLLTGNPGRGYRFYTGTPVYKFGSGLSYSSFKYTWKGTAAPATTVLNAKEVNAQAERVQYDLNALEALDAVVRLSVLVENIGARHGTEVVLVYVRPPIGIAGVRGVPLKSLRFFERVPLAPNEKAEVAVELRPNDFRLTTSDGHFTIHQGLWSVEIGQEAQLVHHVHSTLEADPILPSSTAKHTHIDHTS